MNKSLEAIEQAAARFAEELKQIDGIDEVHELLYIAAVDVDGDLLLASGSTEVAPEGLRETMLEEALKELTQQQ